MIRPLRSVFVRDLDRLPIGLDIPSICFCKSTHPTQTVQASVPRVIRPMEFGHAGTGADINAFFGAFGE